ncbi:hypothetical protein BPOR_0001g00280 [Botrytis porri]|uniref:Uncharacterized protein n=1 Tax=Botrytis porri TaxID=87229 RepID=A0A4Z1L7B2_9HELO|nr:hypothetical protein BPOR_0001g00280 [Botrytis porri]
MLKQFAMWEPNTIKPHSSAAEYAIYLFGRIQLVRKIYIKTANMKWATVLINWDTSDKTYELQALGLSNERAVSP